MCQEELKTNGSDISCHNNNKSKNSYSIKKVLKMLFKKQQKHRQGKMSNSVESLESLDNIHNFETEQRYFVEIEDNSANEKLADIASDAQDDIYVPVRFARTEAGTFFWTTNLQPVSPINVPAADEDLVQPAFCYSTNQNPYMQFQDRWAQA